MADSKQCSFVLPHTFHGWEEQSVGPFGHRIYHVCPGVEEDRVPLSTPDEAREELRDAIDHIEGAVDFQDAINPEAIRVVIDAARKLGPVTDAEVEAAARSLFASWRAQLSAVRAALEASRSVLGSPQNETTNQEIRRDSDGR